MCDPSTAAGISSANFRNSLAVISCAVFAYSCIGLTERAVAIDSVRRFPPPVALLHQIVRYMVWVRRWLRGSGRDNRAGSLQRTVRRIRGKSLGERNAGNLEYAIPDGGESHNRKPKAKAQNEHHNLWMAEQ